MVRVLFYTGIALLAISAALLYLPICFSVILAILIFTALISCIALNGFIKVNGIKRLLIISLAFCIAGIATLSLKVKPYEQLSGFKAEVTAAVWQEPSYYTDYTSYVFKTLRVQVYDSEDNPVNAKLPANVKIRLSDINKNNFKIYDKVTLKVSFNSLGDYKISSLANGIYASGKIESLVSRDGKYRPFYAIFSDARHAANKLIYDNIKYDEATVVSAVLLGDRSKLDTSFYSNAKIAGVSHVLVVSGMHLGILFQIAAIVLGKIGIGKRKISLILIFGIFAVSAICGFTPSVLRAGLTYFILALGTFLYLKPDALNSLGLAAIVILFISPFSVANVSFFLSFLSTFGLIFLCPVLFEKCSSKIQANNIRGRLLKYIVFSVCQTTSAVIATAPVCITVFGFISLVSVITNLLIGYAMTVVLALSLLNVILLCLPGVFKSVSALAIAPLCVLIRYVVAVINYFAGTNFSVFEMRRIYFIPWFIFAAGLTVFVILKRNKIKIGRDGKAVFAVITAVSIMTFSLIYLIMPKQQLKVLSVDGGNCIILSQKNSTIVIGAGDKKNDAAKIQNSLLSLGSTNVDCLLLPDLEKSFAGGAPELLKTMKVKSVIYPKSGGYLTKMEHISGEGHRSFEGSIDFSFSDQFNGVCIAGVGAFVKMGKYDVVVFSDSSGGSAGELMKYCKGGKTILVCAGNIPEDFLNYSFEEVILSGKKENYSQRSDLLELKKPWLKCAFEYTITKGW